MDRGAGGQVVLYTIGHSNVAAETIVELLRSFGVRRLVDVRSVPYSQHWPQFNREALQRTLDRHGVEYRFAGEQLGGRPKDPTCYRDGRLPAGDADYLHLVDYAEVARRPWFQRGLARLRELAAEQPTAILCSEEDPARCHRHHLVAASLLELGVKVRHIRHTREGVALQSAEGVPVQRTPPAEVEQLPLL